MAYELRNQDSSLNLAGTQLINWLFFNQTLFGFNNELSALVEIVLWCFSKEYTNSSSTNTVQQYTYNIDTR